MAMRWSSRVAIAAPPGGRAAVPSTIRSSPSTATLTPQAARPSAIAGEAVAFLDAQLGEPAHHRAALRRRRRRPRGSDIRRSCSARARPARRRPSARRRGHADRRPARRPRSRSFAKAISAPISCRRLEQPGAQRVEPDVLDRDLRARHEQRRDQREGGRGGIARHDEIGAASARAGPSTVMRLPPPSCGSTAHLGAEMAQHALGVVARRPPARSRWSRPAC